MNNNWNKINTREELIELLKIYKGILSDSMINYLNSLIDLEFSVIRDYISDNDRIALSELEVYKRTVMYNVYNRALSIFKQNESELEIYGNNDGIEGLKVFASLGKRSCKLFDFNYWEDPMSLSLFQTIENSEQREAELLRVKSILDRLYDEKNPYHSKPHTYGGPAPQWAFEHAKKIKRYENMYKLLDAKKELTDEDKKEIEIRKKFHELLLEDYGLTNKEFKNNQQFSGFGKDKILVRKMPNININNYIKYIYLKTNKD